MITRNQLSVMLAVAAFAFAAWLTSPALAASYATPAPLSSGIEYVYFDPAAPASPSASGWVGSGKYNLPPDIGGVSVETSAFGSIMTDAKGNPGQAFVVRLNISNNGTQSMTIDPAAVRLVDKAGRTLIGARAFSGNNRITTEAVAAGGKDVLQLEFPLPTGADVKTLEIEDVDLPYAYGALPYVTRLGFVPAAGTATYYAPQAAQAASSSTPAYTTENNYYDYSTPYDTSAYGYPYYGYAGWWGPSWGWGGWWPNSYFVGGGSFFGHDGDFDRDDGFFGNHHGTADSAATTGGTAFGNSKTAGIHGTGTGATAGALSATSNFGRHFGSSTVGGAGNFAAASAGVHPQTTSLFAPRTTAGAFGSPRNTAATTSHFSATPSFTSRGSSAPAAFSAAHFSGGSSAPHVSSFSAPHFSGGSSAPRASSFSAPHFSGGGGGAVHVGGGGGGGFHGGGGGHR